MDIKKVNTKNMLDLLANESAITIEGVNLDEVNMFIDFMVEEEILKKQPKEVYIWTGKFMNEVCKLRGENAYQEDFHFLAIGAEYNGELAGSHPFKCEGKYRWLDDIIGNNAANQRH